MWFASNPSAFGLGCPVAARQLVTQFGRPTVPPSGAGVRRERVVRRKLRVVIGIPLSPSPRLQEKSEKEQCRENNIAAEAGTEDRIPRRNTVEHLALPVLGIHEPYTESIGDAATEIHPLSCGSDFFFARGGTATMECPRSASEVASCAPPTVQAAAGGTLAARGIGKQHDSTSTCRRRRPCGGRVRWHNSPRIMFPPYGAWHFYGL